MKVIAKVEVTVNIDDELILDYAQLNADAWCEPEVDDLSSSEDIDNYLYNNKTDIIDHAKWRATDLLLEVCDEVVLRGHSEFAEVEVIDD